MKLQINGTDYLVRFCHDTTVFRLTEASLLKVVDEKTTEPVYLSPSNALVVVAMCHSKDNFNRVTGRKVAFVRLLEAMEKSGIISGTESEKKELRSYCWAEYMKNFRVK